VENVEKTGFDYPETLSLNKDPLEITFDINRLHCVSNNKPTVGPFVGGLKTNIISGLAYTDLHNANYEGDDIELLDYLHTFLKEYHASSPNPPAGHGRETLYDGLSGCCIAEQVQWEVNDVDMDLFSVAHQWRHCQACDMCSLV
jgi:hypothetical protein